MFFASYPNFHLFAVLCLICLLFFLVSLGGSVVQAQTLLFSGGNGTAESPYQISNATQLDNVRKVTEESYFELVQNIDLSGESNWSPIGNATTHFTGSFNGTGHEISNLNMDRNSTVAGLFGVISKSGTVRDLDLSQVDVNGTDHVGALAGQNQGTVHGVHVYGQVFGAQNSTVAGGLIGQNSGNGTISECYATVDVTSYGAAGGLVGQSLGGTVEDSYATGNVTGMDNIGGLIGLADEQAEINRTYYGKGFVALGESAETNATIGGLIGNGTASVYSSYWDQDASKQYESAGGTGLSTEEMRKSTYYDDSWNFGFGNTWNRDDEYNGGYPYLTNSTLYTVNATIEPEGKGWVDWTGSYPYGSRAELVIYPDVGYGINEVTGCAGSFLGNVFSIDSVTENCTLNVTLGLLQTTTNAGCDPASISSGSEECTDLEDIATTYRISEDYTDGASDRVHFTYAYEANATAGINGTTNATAWLGGFTSDTFNATEIERPAQIVVITTEGNSTEFDFGPREQHNNGTFFSTNDTGTFDAIVGDEVHVEIGSLSTCTARDQGTAHASSNSTLNISYEPYYVLTVNSGSGGGEYLNGTVVAISADYVKGKSFDFWTGDTQYLADSGSPSTKVDMPDSDMSVKATYEDLTYTVSASAGVGGSIDPSIRTVSHGEPTTFTVTPDQGYKIDNVTGCGGSLDGNTYTTSPVTQDCEIRALFEVVDPPKPTTYRIQAAASPEYAGTVTGDGRYSRGRRISLRAKAKPGFEFAGWMESSKQVFSQAEYSFSVFRSRNLTASFRPLPAPGNERGFDLNRDGFSDLLVYDSSTRDILLGFMDGLEVMDGGLWAQLPEGWMISGLGYFSDQPGMVLRSLEYEQVFVAFFNGLEVSDVALVGDVPPEYRLCHVADVNGDGEWDLVFIHQETRKVYVMTMDGTFPQEIWLQGALPENVGMPFPADLTGDQRAELILRDTDSGEVFMAEVGADGWTLTSLGILSMDWDFITRGFFNTDFKADLMFRHQESGETWIFYMDGASVSDTKLLGSIPQTEWDLLTVADYDRDGLSDMLWIYTPTRTLVEVLTTSETVLGEIGTLFEMPQRWRVIEGGFEP